MLLYHTIQTYLTTRSLLVRPAAAVKIYINMPAVPLFPAGPNIDLTLLPPNTTVVCFTPCAWRPCTLPAQLLSISDASFATGKGIHHCTSTVRGTRRSERRRKLWVSASGKPWHGEERKRRHGPVGLIDHDNVFCCCCFRCVFLWACVRRECLSCFYVTSVYQHFSVVFENCIKFFVHSSFRLACVSVLLFPYFCVLCYFLSFFLLQFVWLVYVVFRIQCVCVELV